MNTPESESPVLVPPTDPVLRRQLELKLDEYRARKAGKGCQWEYTHPGLAFSRFPGYRFVFYKVEVLTAVLAATGPVRTFDLSLELARKQGAEFDEQAFNNACGVVEMYLKGEGQMVLAVQRGTGLPKIPATEGSATS